MPPRGSRNIIVQKGPVHKEPDGAADRKHDVNMDSVRCLRMNGRREAVRGVTDKTPRPSGPLATRRLMLHQRLYFAEIIRIYLEQQHRIRDSSILP